MATVNPTPNRIAMISACSTNASASSLRLATMARAMAEETPPPMPPFDIIVISISKGNTKATPASAVVPR